MEPTAYPPKKKRLIVGVNDLKTSFPQIAAELVSADPSEIMDTSVKSQEWKCSLCGKHWNAQPRSRVNTYNPQPGCPQCKSSSGIDSRGKKLLFKDAFPELAVQAVNEEELESLTQSSHKKIAWRCDKGHEYQLSPNKILHGIKCPVCNFKLLDPTYNTIRAVRPDLVEELANEKDADTLFANSKSKITWRHEDAEGITHIWTASPNDRCYYDYGCGVCSGRQVQVGVNDFALILEKYGYKWHEDNRFSPYEITMGSSKKVKVYCDKHSERYVMEIGAKFFTSGEMRCQDCIPTGDKFRSKPEREIYEFVTENFPDEKIENNVKRFKRYSIYDIDIFVNNRIAIDFHGKYWHQEGKFKPVGYHQRKRESMIRHNFPYLEIEEDDWLKDKNQVLDQVLTFVRDNL